MTNIPEGFCQCGCGEYLGFWERSHGPNGVIKGQPKRFVKGHQGRILPSEQERLAEQHQQWWSENTSVPYGFCWCGCERKTTSAPTTNSSRDWIKGLPAKFIQGHSRRWIGYPTHVIKDHGYETPCWIWTRRTTDQRNHGRYGLMLDSEGKNLYAHRYAYESAYGSIPDGMEVHHKCQTTLCVNPEHLRLLSMPEHRSLHAILANRNRARHRSN